MSSDKRKSTLSMQNNFETAKSKATNARKNTDLRPGQAMSVLC